MVNFGNIDEVSYAKKPVSKKKKKRKKSNEILFTMQFKQELKLRSKI